MKRQCHHGTFWQFITHLQHVLNSHKILKRKTCCTATAQVGILYFMLLREMKKRRKKNLIKYWKIVIKRKICKIKLLMRWNVVGLCFLWHEWDWDNDSIYFIVKTDITFHIHTTTTIWNWILFKYELWIMIIEVNWIKWWIEALYKFNLC